MHIIQHIKVGLAVLSTTSVAGHRSSRESYLRPGSKGSHRAVKVGVLVLQGSGVPLGLRLSSRALPASGVVTPLTLRNRHNIGGTSD